jgi:hypothetical protein
MLRPTIVAALVMSLAACASEPPRREFRHRGGAPPGEGRPHHGLFISPAGEPFRGGDGLAAWFAGADADHDGAITAAEFQADAERFFERLDANHDGVVDGFEVSAYEQTIAPEIAAMEFDRQPGGGGEAEGQRRGGGRRGGRGRLGGQFGGDGGGRGPAGAGHEGAGRYSLINEPEPVANADENVDSKVTLEEWRHATAHRFAALDKAKTGRLTLDELRGGRPKRRS